MLPDAAAGLYASAACARSGISASKQSISAKNTRRQRLKSSRLMSFSLVPRVFFNLLKAIVPHASFSFNCFQTFVYILYTVVAVQRGLGDVDHFSAAELFDPRLKGIPVGVIYRDVAHNELQDHL